MQAARGCCTEAGRTFSKGISKAWQDQVESALSEKIYLKGGFAESGADILKWLHAVTQLVQRDTKICLGFKFYPSQLLSLFASN
jgi:hypothetical protein